MNRTDYDFTVGKASNGFIVSESYYEGEDDQRKWKSAKTICPTWADVVKFVQAHEIKE